MGLNYNPGVQSIVAQLIMEGGRQRVQQQNQMVQTVSDMITQHKAKADELKGYQAVYKALSSDPANGLDPDKMPEDVATLKASPLQAETNRNKQAQQKQMLGLAALMEQAGAAAGALPNTGPVANDPMATLMRGQGPMASMVQTPTASPLKAALLKASQNPNLDLKMVQEMVQKAVGQQPQAGFGVDAQTGVPYRQGAGGERIPFNPAWLLPGGKAAADTGRLTGDAPPATAAPEGFVWKRGAQGWEQEKAAAPKYAGKFTDPDNPPPKDKWPDGFEPAWDDEHGHWTWKASPKPQITGIDPKTGQFIYITPGGAPSGGATGAAADDPFGIFQKK